MRSDCNFVEILRSELIPALGCTEPIAIAYASAKARAVLGEFPDRLELYCSGNIVKNVKGVTVPNSGGLKGIDVAGVLGVVCGDEKRELEVLETVTPEGIQRAKQLIKTGFVRCVLQEDVENLYVRAVVFAGQHSAEVTIEKKHTFITNIQKDGRTLFERDITQTTDRNVDKSSLNVKDILAFADQVPIGQVKSTLDRQIEMNSRIAQEGLEKAYGAQVGRTLLEVEGNAVHVRARAKAAAGSDARMGGCSLPVVINSGSGNQGMTLSLPIIEYAHEMKLNQDQLYRALIVSNLLSVHIKRYIGSLSAFCGAVSAACAAGAALTYMCGGTYEQVSATIINTLGNTTGIVCDGAKASCAAKISCALEAAIMAHHMSMQGKVFQADTGIIKRDIEQTIQSIGHVGRVGMKNTDVEILNIMLDNIPLTNCG